MIMMKISKLNSMKLLKKYSFIILLAGLMATCEEEGPYINFNPNPVDSSLIDTTYIATTSETPQTKKILIEDFTGVKCKNCPSAAVKLTQLMNDNPGRIVGIAVHAPTNFGIPYSVSKEDYRNFHDSLIYFMLNGTGSLPEGCVDRIVYPPNTGFMLTVSQWTNAVQQRLAITNAPVNIKITPEFDSSTLELKVSVELFYNEANSFKNYLSVSLLEDNIIDLQVTSDGVTIDSFYHHNHMLRSMMTAYNGDFLMENPEVKRVFRKQYKMKLKSNWNPDNMKIVAFVTLHTDAHRHDVFHVEEVDLK